MALILHGIGVTPRSWSAGGTRTVVAHKKTARIRLSRWALLRISQSTGSLRHVEAPTRHRVAVEARMSRSAWRFHAPSTGCLME